MRFFAVKRSPFNLVVLLAWTAVLSVLLLSLGLSEVRHARQQLAMDMAQLNNNAGNLLVQPLLLDPQHPNRLALLAQATEQLEQRLEQDVRLLGLTPQVQRLKQLRETFADFEREQEAVASLARLLGSMADVPSTEMQLQRLLQNLRGSTTSANDLVRLRAFLLARRPATGLGAVQDPFLVGVANAPAALRAGIETIDRFESHRTDVLSMTDELRLSSLQDVEVLPVGMQRNLSVSAAVVGLLLLVLMALRQPDNRRLVPPDEIRRLVDRSAPAPQPSPAPPVPPPAPPIAPPAAPMAPPALSPVPPQRPDAKALLAVSDMSLRFDSVCRELQTAVDSAVESSAGFDRRVKSMVEGAVNQPNESAMQMAQTLQQLDGLLLHAREGAINMAFGLDESLASEKRFSAAELLERHLTAAMALLSQLHAFTAGETGRDAEGPQTLVSRRTLTVLQFELQHQLARQQAELRSLSKRLQQLLQARPLSP
ncbi:hypothetical protein [Hydrogenophaga sp.]|uniref:hypothetical protein n=1 Tax=Hydrogenophaga sp. TaxID=1904254 RepID=UPI003F6CA81A